MFLRSASEWVLLHTVTGSRLATVVGSRPRPNGAGRIRIGGPAPIRILVTGGGLAVGYGVTEWDDALGGALGRALAARCGRGIAIDQTPLHTSDPDEMDLVMTALDGSGYDIVVWSPWFTEDPSMPAPDGWKTGARAAQRTLGGTGCGCKGHIVLGVPELDGGGRDERIITTNIRRANAHLAAMAAAAPNMRYVAAPHLGPLDGTGPRFGREYYERVAEALLTVASRMLGGASSIAS